MMDATEHVAHIELILHEIRTPVNVTAGSLAQILEPDAGPIAPGQLAAVQRARRACAQIEQLAEELRDWAELVSGPQRLVPISVGAALREAALAAEATRDGHVRVALPDPLDDRVRALAPAGYLPRALRALLSALIRTARDGTAVPVTLQSNDADRRVTLLFGQADTGPTVTFAAERLGGLGFALPLARAVIEAAGGRVWSVESSGRLAGIGLALPASER
jgi:signal transduction histidine kinase